VAFFFGNLFIFVCIYLFIYMNKNFVIILPLLLLAFSGIVLVNSSFGQITSPVVPEFSLKYIEHPYDIPPTTSVDPYTGKTVTTQEGYHVQNGSIVLTVKNQQFAPYTDSQGNYIVLSYNVSIKGSYSVDWKYYYPDAYWRIPLIASKGDYTVITFGSRSSIDENDQNSFLFDVPSSGQIDFKVEASIGHYNETVTPFPISGGELHTFNFIGEKSGWSNTKTINLDNNSTTSSPAATVKPSQTQNSEPTPTQPISPTGQLFGFDWQIIALIIALVVIVALALLIIIGKKLRKS
jgi:hypothetical protein